MQEQLEYALPTSESARILLVDDDPMMLQAVSQMLALRLNEVHVDTADSAQAALQQLQKSCYDAVLSDIKMPGMNGLDLLETVQQLQLELPVVLMTGYNEHDLAIRALRSGAYDYLLKPVERDELVAAIRRAIHTGQLRRQVQLQQRALVQYAQRLEQQVAERTQELFQANRELQAISQAREQVLQVVAHELAGPVTGLKGMLYLARRHLPQDTAQEKVRHYVQTMEGAVYRLQRLIGDLQDITYIQTRSFAIERRWCNLVELCQQVLDGFTQGRTLLPQPDPEPLMANVDLARMSQVLLNLLSNARKYSPPGSPITVQLQQSTTHIILSVQDQGRGIPEEALSRIYEQFYRVPETERQTSPSSGLGLGLSIARVIVEQHDGRIDVQSLPGKGSTFSVQLPAEAEQAPLPAIQWVVCDEKSNWSYSSQNNQQGG